jgi:hypothetical protein
MQTNCCSKIKMVPTVAMLMAALAQPMAWAQTANNGILPTLQQKYQITEFTADGKQITRNGTTMNMKVAGVYTLPTSLVVVPDTKVNDGKLQSPSMLVKVTWVKMGTHVLQAGEKVYVTKIDSKEEANDSLLKFTVLTTADPNDPNSSKKYQGSVSFHFKKGYLQETPPEQVEQAVEAVLAPDEGTQAADNAGAPAAPPPPVAPPPPPPPPPRFVPPPPVAAPATVTVGESSTEVLQSLGMPQQMIDLGKKKTFVYRTMKITFINDKVSDVQ